jgi:transposase InsO family protein
MGDIVKNLFDDAVCEIVEKAEPRFHRPHIAVTLSSISLKGLYDTGADVSCLNEKVFQKIDKKDRPTLNISERGKRFKSAGGELLQVIGKFLFQLKVGKKVIEHPLYVVKNLSGDLILGFDLIQKHHLNYNTETKSFSWKGGGRWSRGQLKVCEKQTLAPLSVSTIRVSVRTDAGHTPSEDVPCLVDIVSPESPLIYGAPTMVQPDRFGNAIVQVINCAPIEMELNRNDFIGFAENLQDCEMKELNPDYVQAVAERVPTKQAPLGEAKKKFIEEKLNLANVPAEFRQQYRQVILKHHEAISQHKFDLGRANTLMHEITLKTNEPIYVKQFKIPEAHREDVEKHVAEWLKLGVVQPSRSRYNSPLFVVMKKNGGIRLVQDFRALNANSHIDKYSMKDVSECIGEIGRSGSTIFTTIDLTAGFWQMVLHPRARPYTAFTVPGKGQFEWIGTPQGCLGAPASFQRLMETVVANIANVIVYIDDLLLHSENHPSHIELLDQVLGRLVKNGIKMNLEKCVFGSKKVSYLGFQLTEEGIKPGTDKLKAVALAAPPSSVREVRQFLGLCNFFRTHVKNFAQISAPLTALTRKDSPWKAGDLPSDALKSFRELQSCLVSEPVMAYPRRNRKYALITDASLGDEKKAGGLGAILTQLDEKGEHQVIAYASRKLQKHECNYTPFLLEMQAAIWGMEHFAVYLRGRPFTLYSDHKPLEKLGKVHTKTFNRLQEAMNQFNFQICYQKGEEMPADFLSRNVVSSILSESANMASEQEKDPVIKSLKDFLINRRIPTDDTAKRVVTFLATDCFIDNGVVWRRIKRSHEPSRVVLFLPRHLTEEVLKEAHGSLLSGHDGVLKTKERILSCYYWPGMDKDINQHIQTCHKCQVRKKNPQPTPALLSPLPQCTEPNQRVHADLFGPLRVSGHQKKFILCMTDAFTKYVELVALPNKESATVACAIFERWICRHGCPLEIITDQGKEFCGQLTEDLFKLLSVRHNTTTAHHPQCNSQAEVANKTIAKYLASFVDASTLEWEDLLPPLMFSYNTSFHRSIKATPFYLTFGIEPRQPGFEQPDLRRKFYGESSTDELLHKLQLSRDIARLNNEDATLTAQMQYNAKAEPHNFKVGQLVLLRETYFLNKNVKLAPKWTGPHRILALKGPCNAELKLQNNRKLVVHTNRLKEYLSAEKNQATFPEEQAWAEPSDVHIPEPKSKKKMPSTIPAPPTDPHQPDDFFYDYNAFRDPPPMPDTSSKTYSEALQAPPRPPSNPTPAPSRPRGRPRKSSSSSTAPSQISSPIPIPANLSTAPPNSDLISSRTRSKFASQNFSAPGGSEGESTNNGPGDTADVSAAATHTHNYDSSQCDSDEEGWMLVVKKQRNKKKTDNSTARQRQVFKQTGDIYDYLPYKNGSNTAEYISLPAAANPAGPLAALQPAPVQPAPVQPIQAPLPQPGPVQVQQPAPVQPAQVPLPQAGPAQVQQQQPQPVQAPRPQAPIPRPQAVGVAPQAADNDGAAAAANVGPDRQRVNPDDRPLPALQAKPERPEAGVDDDRDQYAGGQNPDGRDVHIRRRDQLGPDRLGDRPDVRGVGRATKDRRNPRAHTEGARPRTGGHPDRLDVGQPLFVIPEEDEPGLADIQPPEFAASPHTPRTHPRYSFRPSPSRTPPPEDLSPLRTTLEDAFREADEALFGPRLTRRQAPPLPDDVVQRYPSERKKKKPK